jgi:adenosylcobinamide amidohydrolase
MTTSELMSGVMLRHLTHALHIQSQQSLHALSSAVYGGGETHIRHILNLGVPPNYSCGNYMEDLRQAASGLYIHEPYIGLLTAARIADAQVVTESNDHATVAVVLTLGISHPTAAGVSGCAEFRPGTINTIVIVDGCLSPGARVNAVMTATEAKSLVLAECSVHTATGHLASGTGTDAMVVASTERGTHFEYGGPVSCLGALIGRAVRAAMLNATYVWYARRQVEAYRQ